MSPQRLYTDSPMLLRREEARTEIRGQRNHTDPDEEVLLLNFGIFTTSLCLLCGCWQSHVYTETERELCVCYCGPSCGETFKKVFGSYLRKNSQTHFFPWPCYCEDGDISPTFYKFGLFFCGFFPPLI